MYIGCDGGIFKTTTGSAATSNNPCDPTYGITYTPLNTGYATIQFYHGAVAGPTPTIAAGAQDNGAWLYVSGTDWNMVTGGDGGYAAVDPTNPARTYTSYVYTTIYREDSSGTATILSSGQLTGGSGIFINPYMLDPNNNKVMYTTNEYLYKTADCTASTVTWTSIGLISTSAEITCMAVAKDSSYVSNTFELDYFGDSKPRL
jgi:hypothetical protein